jgi:hypothetical protein
MNNLQTKLVQISKKLLGLRAQLFILMLVLVYGFIGWRIDTLSHAQPSPGAASSQTSLLEPTINQSTINKITQLTNNSVSVQALFSQARQNPFQE